jgi:hypothetical protein
VTKTYASPRVWIDDELTDARLLAIGDFIAGRTEEGGQSYADFMAEAIAGVEKLLDATADLTTDVEKALVGDARLDVPLRHVPGPPISEADLAVMADVPAKPRAYKQEQAERIVTLALAGRDRARFPWLDAMPTRTAEPDERRAAVIGTAALRASQRLATKRRNESAGRQEAAVKSYLTTKGFVEVPARPIDLLDDLDRGQYCGEAIVAGDKADISVRLRDGRLLLIECKVSNSALNSVKRLNDIGNKVATWRRFGDLALPMGVLAGVFKLPHLRKAQGKGIALVWERDLAPLGEFVDAAV